MSGSTLVEKPTTITEEPLVMIEIKEQTTKLTEEQKKILKHVYEHAKTVTKPILEDRTVEISVKIAQTIAEIVKMLEYVQINQQKLSGSNKKAVALELGRLLIIEILQDESIKKEVLTVYDIIAEQTLEIMINVSRKVNAKVEEAANSCLDWLFSPCGKK